MVLENSKIRQTPLRRIFRQSTKWYPIHKFEEKKNLFKYIEMSYTFRSQHLASRCFICIRRLQCTIVRLCVRFAAAARNHNFTSPCDLEEVSLIWMGAATLNTVQTIDTKNTSFLDLDMCLFLKHNSGGDPQAWVGCREHLSLAPMHAPCLTLPRRLGRSCRSLARVRRYPQQGCELVEIP